jgi:hypothetical protein
MPRRGDSMRVTRYYIEGTAAATAGGGAISRRLDAGVC